jgi:hypothetical protein
MEKLWANLGKESGDPKQKKKPFLSEKMVCLEAYKERRNKKLNKDELYRIILNKGGIRPFI